MIIAMEKGQPTTRKAYLGKQQLVVENDPSLLAYLKQRRASAILNINVLKAAEELNNYDQRRLEFFQQDMNDCSKAIAMLTGFH